MFNSVAPYALSLIVACVVSAIILLFGLTVMWQMWSGRLDLAYLISEPQLTAGKEDIPKASLSRFQFLVFTFVIAGLYLVLSIEAGTMVDVPEGALVLLGISGGSYLVSKVESTRAAKEQAADERADERQDMVAEALEQRAEAAPRRRRQRKQAHRADAK
jgi:hypothetical protein